MVKIIQQIVDFLALLVMMPLITIIWILSEPFIIILVILFIVGFSVEKHSINGDQETNTTNPIETKEKW